MVDDLIDTVGSAKYLTTLDCTKGYWAVPLDDDAISLTGFVTPFGHLISVVCHLECEIVVVGINA